MANIVFETAATFVSGTLQNSACLSTLADKLAQGNSVYLKTLGFYAEGDGGGACYKIVASNSNDDPFSFDSATTLRYANGCFRISGSNVAFKLLPQGNSIKAEQFGVLPVEETDVDFSTRATYNLKLLKALIKFAADNGNIVTFVSRDKIFVNPDTLALYSKSYIDGNGATLQIDNSVTSNGEANLFSTPDKMNSNEENIYVKSLNLVGRKTSATAGKADQAFHLNAKNFTTENVSISQFRSGYHTFGKNATADYEVPPMGSKNWLLKNCRIKNTDTGLNLSEIDGIIIKNTDIFCYIGTKFNHCMYFTSNCSNIRTTNGYLGNTAGGAIHKFYPVDIRVDTEENNIRGDISHNQFYTDVFIHNAETCWHFNHFCHNTMCDSNFATEISRVLVTGASSNCIIANSEVDKASSCFITVSSSVRFWMQNSHIVYSAHHRTTEKDDAYINDPHIRKMNEVFMNSGLEDRRYHTGPNRDTIDLRFKFTGCNIESIRSLTNNYYAGFKIDNTTCNNTKVKTDEYVENCKYTLAASSENAFKFYCTNSLPSGITFRNSYIYNPLTPKKKIYRYMCGKVSCDEETSCELMANCYLSSLGRLFPWLRSENSFYENVSASTQSGIMYLFSTSLGDKTSADPQKAVCLSNSYVSDCYVVRNNQISKLDNICGDL